VLSIRWIATAGAALLTAGAVLCVGAVSERNARQALEREMETRTLLLARNLALTSSGALLGEFPELTLQPVVREMLARQPELDFAVVVDHRDLVQGHPDARRLGTRFTPPADLHPLAAGLALAPGEALGSNRTVLVAQVHVRQPGGQAIGRAYVALKRHYIESTLAASRRQQMLVMALFVVLGLLSALALMSQLLRPVGVLRAGLERIGRGDLDTPIRLKDRTELGLLADTVNEMTRTLKQAQAEMVERERLSHEVDLARQIQQSLLPAQAAHAGRYTVSGDQRAAAEVGGDYFDILPLQDGRIAIAVADVAGKGLAGCLVMSMLSALLRAFRESHDSPAALLATLDERLSESLRPGVFVTMFYGILDPETGRLVYASAGHNPMLLYRQAERRVEVLGSKGIPLAAVRGGAIRRTLCDQETWLDPGDLALEFTDGYTEAFDRTGREEFGIERMVQIVERTAEQGAEVVLAALRCAVREWSGDAPASDDETLLVIASQSPVTDVPQAIGVEPRGDADAVKAMQALAQAEAGGLGLTIPARLESLDSIRQWLHGQPVLGELQGNEADWLASALYEISANVVEHGFRGQPQHSLELWWLPGREQPMVSGEAPAAAAARMLRRGSFVLRDDGTPFLPGEWKASDFSDPEVRRRGRGIGLDIIHQVMREVAYHPATPRGNITILTFGPRIAAGVSREGN
jgi:serine phosphatase RsbU (regulator of sigma subunit)/anti-sigma regulatory factor (Ser/Thr protein kinase)